MKLFNAILIAIIIINSGCQNQPNSQVLDSSNMYVVISDEDSVEMETGFLTVPLIRDAAGNDSIQIDYYKFKSLDPSSNNIPIFVLMGGPGATASLPERFSSERFYSEVKRYREIADVVFVGQRGIGSASPSTSCPPGDSIHIGMPVDMLADKFQEACKACKDEWEAKDVNLQGFNVIEAAGDVADLSRALGYEKIVLQGTSFGSHWAMAVMRFYPDVVERALLSGVEGPDHTYDMPSHVLNSIERIAAAAEESEELKLMIPEGGIIENWKNMLSQVSKKPVEVPVKTKNGQEVVVKLTADDIQQLIFGVTSGISSRRSMPAWPADMLAMINRDFSQAAELFLGSSGPIQLGTASFFMLDCGSGISPDRLDQLNNDPATEIVGDLGWFYKTTCEVWVTDLGDEFRQNFETSIPTLIVHGTWDTSTPLENAEELAPYFTNGKLVKIEGGSHNALVEALEASEEFEQMVNLYLADGSIENLPETIELSPIEWTIPSN